MPTTGLFNRMAPVLPKKVASPKVKTELGLAGGASAWAAVAKGRTIASAAAMASERRFTRSTVVAPLVLFVCGPIYPAVPAKVREGPCLEHPFGIPWAELRRCNC